MTKKTSVEITIPVYNEEEELSESIKKLHTYCTEHLGSYAWHITIADNASTDTTPRIARQLEKSHPHISLMRFEQKGRGRAVKTAWMKSNANICCYMDVDLSTDLSHLPGLIAALEKGNDIAIGTRLKRRSKVIDRTIKREVISRLYNLLITIMFRTRFSDAQCGFKAATRHVVQHVLPHIEDNEWFMDSELLITAEKLGYRIYEEPVLWRDNPGSTVRVLPTAMGDLHGLGRLWLRRPWHTMRQHERSYSQHD